ncbi:hypothetical protein JAAARDRAFT_711167 [Jaapia argillacea MUCL 33604]|uniref:Uncharacterized protein n=1 Tax=Jaapia argillacea MUCL 33604 TaxID=933084 RepID=A0A067P5W3_9AGAM|nr:hypothetical protein JAAARDRAFT_711167 [Jaapia argillacea MUCL 33604]
MGNADGPASPLLARVRRSGKEFSPQTLASIGIPVKIDFQSMVDRACHADLIADLCKTAHEDSPTPSPSVEPRPAEASIPPPNLPQDDGELTTHPSDKKHIAAQAVEDTNLKVITYRHRGKVKKVSTNLKTSDLSVASTGWEGGRVKLTDPERAYSLDEMKRMGFSVVAWDGVEPHAVLDRGSTIVAMLAGRPRDGQFIEQVANPLFKAMERTREHCSMSSLKHWCSHFAATNVGISRRPGPTEPQTLQVDPKNQLAIAELLSEPSLQRLVGFTASAFNLYAPRLYQYYQTTLDSLLQWKPTLCPYLANSPFAACMFNFGPDVQTFVHTDLKNLPWGWCVVTALGGHLVLWDLKLVVEFPPGSTIFIPSGIIRHSNIPVAEGEVWLSYTQYTAGSVFRWVGYGFRSVGEVMSTLGEAEVRRLNAGRWEAGCQMWSKLGEFFE